MHAAIADIDGNGYLDIAYTNYVLSGERHINSQVLWGSAPIDGNSHSFTNRLDNK